MGYGSIGEGVEQRGWEYQAHAGERPHRVRKVLRDERAQPSLHVCGDWIHESLLILPAKPRKRVHHVHHLLRAEVLAIEAER